MGAYENLIANIDKVAYTSVFDMDKIIGTAEDTMIIPISTPGPPVVTVDTFSTGFGDTYYFQGIYSTDGGASWNDFGSIIPNLTTPGMPVLDTLDVQGAVSSTGTMNIITFNYYDSVHGVGNTYVLKWKVIFYSKNNQGRLTPLPIADPTHFTSMDRFIQKIALKGEVAFDVTSGVANAVTITHNLGYVPMVRAFYAQTSPEVRIDSLWGGYKIQPEITETDVTFRLDAALSAVTATGFIEYRIYYER